WTSSSTSEASPAGRDRSWPAGFPPHPHPRKDSPVSTTTTPVLATEDRPRPHLLRKGRREVDPTRPGQRARSRRETAVGFAFLTPWLIGFLGLTLVPMAYSLYLSFTRYNIFQPPRLIGFDNYIRLFTKDPVF